MIKNQWYAILPARVVRKNKILMVKRLNLDLVIFMDGQGKLGCIVDQCTHRGAALSKGKIKGGCIQCPFHGLEFNKDGECKFIPANGISSKEDISRYNIKRYILRESNDIIYLWYGDDNKITEKLPFF